MQNIDLVLDQPKQKESLIPFEDRKKVRAQITAVEMMVNGKVLLQNGEREMGLNLLRQAANREPKNVVVLTELARHLSIAEKLSEALCVWQGILKLEFTPEAVREIAHLHYKTGENQHALNSYYEYLAVAPEDDPHIYEVFKNMGNIFTRTGDYDSAEEYYHRAFRLRPYSDVLMVNYATLSYQRGELDRAVEFFRNAVRTNPKNEMGWTGLAMMHRQFGDFDLAWADLERGLELAPQNRSAVILAADWAIKDRKEVRGAEIVSEYLSLAGPDEEMSLVLINLFCAMGRLELADIEIERVLSWNPSRKDVRELREKLRDKL